MKSTRLTSTGEPVVFNHVDGKDIHEYRTSRPGVGYNRHGKREVKVTLSSELFEAIRKEALARGWGVARMIRHLCEASIEGIE